MRNTARFSGLWVLLVLLLAGCGVSATNVEQQTSTIPTPVVSRSETTAEAGALSGTPAGLCEAALPAADPTTRDYAGAQQVLQPGVDYRAILCTETGAIYVDLFEEFAPITVNNFVFLAQNDYYNNITFHRVLADFMAQGGDPTGTGSGGPGYQFEDEFVGFLNFDRVGLLAMANAGPGTNGSQFFITTAVTDWLNYRHTIFGEVLTGNDNVAALPLRDPQTDSQPGPRLDTILIITEPSGIEVNVEFPAPAAQADVDALVSNLPELPGLVVDAAVTGVRDRDTLLGGYPESIRNTVGEVLSGGTFAASIAHDNAACDLQNVPLMRLSYSLYAFDDRTSAQAALENTDIGLIVTLGEAFETEEVTELPHPVYTRSASSCGITAVEARTYWQRGRFIAVLSAIVPAESQATPVEWLANIVGVQYEFMLADILRPEIWNK